MSEQFPVSGQSSSSQEALERLLKTLETYPDDRLPNWIAEWAYDKCKEEIIQAETELMRQEHYGYAEDAHRTREYLKSYEDAMKIIMAFKDYVKWLAAEDFGRKVGPYLREKFGQPNAPAPGTKEVKPRPTKDPRKNLT
jgi:hypothetical protein